MKNKTPLTSNTLTLDHNLNQENTEMASKLKALFHDGVLSEQDLSQLDTRQVTTMHGIFDHSHELNQYDT
jgi:hypothetical protein